MKQCAHNDNQEMVVHLYASDDEVAEAVAEIVEQFGGEMAAVNLGDSNWGAEYVFTGSLATIAEYMRTYLGMDDEELAQWDITCLTCAVTTHGIGL